MVHNFSAGPCILPQEVLQKASESVKEFNGIGLSLIEISHRSKPFVEVMDKAVALVKELLNVPETHEVLFLQGGASLGFYTSAMNFLKEGGTGAYHDSGTWSAKAIKEAKLLGNVEVVASGKENGYRTLEMDYTIPASADYFHLTSNNTIYGTQWPTLPKTDAPLICDMSSDIFSREINVSDFALIYAGAQKNMGPAGTVLYIVNKELLGKTGRTIPSYLDLEVHISKDSMFNTPPVFAIYTSMLMLEWLKNLGGVAAIEKVNNQKAELLYNEIDNNPLFEGYASKDSRSKMNVTFNLTDASLEEEFNAAWNKANISGIKGHRSVGGYRASMYNALPLSSVQALVNVMKEFANVTA
ncbi:MAG: 3-phosphoserine/phosphohydroxythreonine transaminase [Flavobacteriales bacterium]